MSETVHPNQSLEGQAAVDAVAEILRGPASDTTHEPVTDNKASDEQILKGEQIVEEEPQQAPTIEESEPESEAESDDAPEAEHSQEAESDVDQEPLAALAGELGLDADKLVVDDDGDVFVKLKVNGKDEHVSLKEAVSQTQYYKANEEKSRVLAEERKAFEAERQSVAEQYQREIQRLQGVGQMLEQKFLQEYNSINWAELRATNPAEWVAKQQEFQMRQNEMHQAGQIVGQQLAAQDEFHREQEMVERQRTVEAERVALTSAIPEWSDQEKMRDEMTSLIEYARGEGYPDEELADIVLSRHVLTLRKAMMYDRGKQVAEKKVKKAPKMQRAANGRFTGKKESQIDRYIKAAQDAKGANKRSAQADAVAALLSGEM